MTRSRKEAAVRLISLLVLTGIVAFVAGVLAHDQGTPIAKNIREAVAVVVRFKRTGTLSPKNLVFQAPHGSSRNSITIPDPEALLDGYTAVMAWNHPLNEYGVKLFDRKGNERHYWPIDYWSVDPDGPTSAKDEPHGLKLMSDGSVMIVFSEGDVMARFDACGKPKWVTPGVYHHSVEYGEDGTFWAWRGEGTAYGHYQFLEEFDAETGEVLRSISLVDDIIGKNDQATEFSLTESFEFQSFEENPANSDDMFHPNDAEVLTRRLAPKFPLFSAGDVLISIRNPNLVAVLDPGTGELKWRANGPWVQQHDPDFTEDGKIIVYNNNRGRAFSSIIEMDPETREVRELFTPNAPEFYSAFMGKQQLLPDSSVLITIPEEGRVLHVNENGETLFEFVNVVNERSNGHVENAQWVPADFFSAFPACSD